jgi:hypothetical protein
VDEELAEQKLLQNWRQSMQILKNKDNLVERVKPTVVKRVAVTLKTDDGRPYKSTGLLTNPRQDTLYFDPVVKEYR